MKEQLENANIKTTKKLIITETIDNWLQEQVDRVAQFSVNNLMQIAASAVCEFGVEPTFEQVFEDAAPIAYSPDTYVFNRELNNHLDDAEDRDEPGIQEPHRFDTRKGLTGKQYEWLMRNSRFVLENGDVLKEFRKQGYVPSTSRQDQYKIAIQERRERLTNWRQRDDQRELLRRAHLTEEGKKLTNQLGV
jgi:hypothetical protein